jgi:hypothetical protein
MAAIPSGEAETAPLILALLWGATSLLFTLYAAACSLTLAAHPRSWPSGLMPLRMRRHDACCGRGSWATVSTCATHSSREKVLGLSSRTLNIVKQSSWIGETVEAHPAWPRSPAASASSVDADPVGVQQLRAQPAASESDEDNSIYLSCRSDSGTAAAAKGTAPADGPLGSILSAASALPPNDEVCTNAQAADAQTGAAAEPKVRFQEPDSNVLLSWRSLSLHYNDKSSWRQRRQGAAPRSKRPYVFRAVSGELCAGEVCCGTKDTTSAESCAHDRAGL